MYFEVSLASFVRNVAELFLQMLVSGLPGQRRLCIYLVFSQAFSQVHVRSFYMTTAVDAATAAEAWLICSMLCFALWIM